MSPNGQSTRKKITPPDNIYTVIIAVAFCIVFATVVLVAFKCYSQYGTFFGMP
jgi:hypothetical protein